MLAPGRPDRRIQPVDVRDLAAFALHTAAGQVGTFNIAATQRASMSDLLAACRDVTDSDAEFEWVTDEQWLTAQGVAQWTELPLWRTYRGVWDVDSSRALAAGLTPRSLEVTVADTWEWLTSDGEGINHERAAEQGIDPAKEKAILGVWDAYQLDHCGGT